jgi:hypothetical protein
MCGVWNARSSGQTFEELLVDQAMRRDRVIDLKTAQALGLTFPSSLLFLADEVIR